MNNSCLAVMVLLPTVLSREHSDLSQAEQLLQSVQESLEIVYQDHLQTLLTRPKPTEVSPEKLRRKRNSQFPKITRKKKKIRGCQNMAGILGGTNAFNFINFVAAVVTLIGKPSKDECFEFSKIILKFDWML